MFLDESHVIGQIGGMYNGDRARKTTWWSTASACRARWTTGR
jgi:excinuclease UvrABC helicase subunit UvrB